jgi:hypothetical protein
MMPLAFTARRFQRLSSFDAMPEEKSTAANPTAVSARVSARYFASLAATPASSATRASLSVSSHSATVYSGTANGIGGASALPWEPVAGRVTIDGRDPFRSRR